MFKPFKNDHQSMQIGELIFENQTDKVIVYGDIDITKTATGLEHALKLKKVFADIADALENNMKDDGNVNTDSNDDRATVNQMGGLSKQLRPKDQVKPDDVNNDTQSPVEKIISNPFS